MKNYAWVLEVRPGYEEEYKTFGESKKRPPTVHGIQIEK